MALNCGIVGLPNVGKSTLFNALTETAAAQAANYPFCTIDPNVGRVSVPDDRLQQLAKIAGSRQIIPAQLECVDIAGLVRGASQGAGLGNQFLSHIRQTDAIIHVVRCFENDDIAHVDGKIDPIRDIETIETELLLSDLESVQKRMVSLSKKAKQNEAQIQSELKVGEKILPILEQGKNLRGHTFSLDESRSLQSFHLLSVKPMLYVCNVNEDEALAGNLYTQSVEEYAHYTQTPVIWISARIEEEVCALPESEKQEFLQSLGFKETGLARIARVGYQLLNLMSFFTIGPKEAHAWTLQVGMKAPQAAGVIHTDFEKGFICAETISCSDYLLYQGESGAKANGKMRLEGKEYTVCDGDVIHFRFNV